MGSNKASLVPRPSPSSVCICMYINSGESCHIQSLFRSAVHAAERRAVLEEGTYVYIHIRVNACLQTFPFTYNVHVHVSA